METEIAVQDLTIFEDFGFYDVDSGGNGDSDGDCGVDGGEVDGEVVVDGGEGVVDDGEVVDVVDGDVEGVGGV